MGRLAWIASALALTLGFGCAAGDAPPGRADAGDGAVTVTDSGFDAGRADSGVDGGPVEEVGLCEACVVHPQCGSLGRCVPLTDGEFACAAICNPDIPSCPRGFECVVRPASPDFPVCVPVGERCCVDQDADGYGRGVGCDGADCDDEDIDVNPGALELCNGGDDDCDGAIDEEASDCGGQLCRATGMGYEEVTPGSCVDGACVDGAATSCGRFSCDMGADEGERCATTCTNAGVDDDTLCIASAHCDLGVCDPDQPNGGTCDEDTDCASAHCDNGFCCDDGACCATATDCPGSGSVGTTCDDSAGCQGTRGEIICEMNRCATRSGVPDDSACDSSVEANTCGFFTSVFCTGAANQTTPGCATTCTADTDCDANAHCDFSVCVPDLPDGQRCDETSDCISGHCQNGFCCASGDCCGDATNCPASYSTPAVCETPTSCQGDRDVATCVAFQCGTMMGVADDSACDSAVLANDCGLYPSRFCTGATNQTPPSCPSSCTADSECDGNAHCDLGMCTVDLPDGSACDEASDCVTGHCQNGFCCASGDCCAAGTDCPAATYGEPSVCSSAATCQGQRRDPMCNSTNQCQLGGLVDDDSGCAGLQSNACGLYPAVACTSAMSQSPDQMSRCAMACASSGDCDSGAFCNAMGQCEARGMLGDACTATAQCESGLSCVDGVCCSSACTGTCMACNVPSSLGTCTFVPSGTDPAGECGGLSCATYYHGWVGDMCYRRADAPASAVSCNGAGTCETGADVCPSQGRGALQTDCNDLCQSPTSGTCTGTSAGACGNTTPSPATQSCGTGECRVTANRCNSGTPVTCVPDSPVSETCNGLDDDCDSRFDEGLPGDAWESNNTCGTARNLGTIYTAPSSGRPATITLTPTLYASGDADYYTLVVAENDSTCHFCDIFGDEDVGLTGEITVPSGAGSYEICVHEAGSCPSFSGKCRTVVAGSSGTRIDWGDGQCGSDDSRRFYVRVRGIGAPAFSCQPYTLTLTGMGGCE
ncbi:MAG: putative metal-binding motif-containing protein [Sandaracinaceae bacterium]